MPQLISCAFLKDEEILEEMIPKALVRSKLGNTVHHLEHILSVLKLAVKAVLKKAYSQHHTDQWLTSFALTRIELWGTLVSRSAAAHQQINTDFILVKGFPLSFSLRYHFHSLYKLTYVQSPEDVVNAAWVKDHQR